MLFKNATILLDKGFKITDCFYSGGTIVFSGSSFSGTTVPSFSNCIIFPGFCDVHVHLREPGFSYKETVKSGTAACAKGGYTAVCSMPNLDPVPDSLENLKVQSEIIEKDASIAVYPYGSLTVEQKGEKESALEELAPYVVAFSDDGKGVQSTDMMRNLMQKAKTLGKTVVAHCEDNSLLKGGYIHDGEYAKLHGHRGICSESEWRQVKRDLELVKEIGCSYHVCHISAKETVDLIRKAKKQGLDVTCETAPHYLVMNDMDLKEDGRFKMNPPIRGEEDRLALIDGIKDGTIDMIATDHAPHSAEEKSRGLEKSVFGIVGIETAFPILYTHLVKNNIISLQELARLMCYAPRERFKIESDIGFSVWDVETPYQIDPDKFLSLGKSTPWQGDTVYGKNLLTVYQSKEIYKSI